MPVSKQTYTAPAIWTADQLADIYRSAFIDAGLMTDWHDSFTITDRAYRVFKHTFDSSKTYGTTYYYFGFRNDSHPFFLMSTGWDEAGNVPTGTRHIDYLNLPSEVSNGGNSWRAQSLTWNAFGVSSTSDASITRYTSTDDPKQSWFLFRNGNSVTRPFTFFHPQTSLHQWLDLNKGIISDSISVATGTVNAYGFLSFRLNLNLRSCLITGHALRGYTEVTFTSGNSTQTDLCSYVYGAVGSRNNEPNVNYGSGRGSSLGAIYLPVGKTLANPAFTSDYVPICTGLPWSPFTPTPLASDFAVYMHYANNTIQIGDRFIVTPGAEEWEVVAASNNGYVNDGASSTFLARVV